MNKLKLGSLVGTSVRVLSLDGREVKNTLATVEEVSEYGILFREVTTRALLFGTTCSFRVTAK